MGGAVLIKAFCATIIGGFGSVPGAVVGGVFLGIVEILAAGYVSTFFKDGLAFGVIILILLLAPQGIFGEKVAERA
jgi:branched-chain amino acid transport system permease protein